MHGQTNDLLDPEWVSWINMGHVAIVGKNNLNPSITGPGLKLNFYIVVKFKNLKSKF